MGDISEEEYERLDLKQALEYTSIDKVMCATEGCKEHSVEKTVDSEAPPFDFIYGKEISPEGTQYSRNMPIKYVCQECMFKMHTISTEYFKKKQEKFRVNVPKAKGDRGKNYYRDFSKQGWKDDPNAGQGATELSSSDINRLNNL